MANNPEPIDEAFGSREIVPLLKTLSVGDRILFNERQVPLEVTKGPTTSMSPGGGEQGFVSVEGPQGGDYDIVWGDPSGPEIPDLGPVSYLAVVETTTPSRGPSSMGDPEFGFGGFEL